MAADDQTTAGTPEHDPNVGNAGDATGTTDGYQDGGNAEGVEGAASAEERAELEALRRQKGQWLAEKSGYETAKQELERLRASSPPPMDAAAAQANTLMQRLAAKEQELQYRAQVLNDDEALLQLALLHQGRQQQQELAYRTQMLEVEKEVRADVERMMHEAQMRGEYISAQTAKRLVQLERLAAKSSDLENKERELTAAQEARARGVVATRTVGVPRSELNKSQMTSEEFGREWDRLDADGRRKLNAALNSGRVRISG
jgi:hypothetical protein